jgi:hypothetical protein
VSEKFAVISRFDGKLGAAQLVGGLVAAQHVEERADPASK